MEHNTEHVTPHATRPEHRRAKAGVAFLILGCFLLGVAVTVACFNRSSAGREAEICLSPATRSVLAALTAPVDLRFYSLLEKTNLPPSVPALSAYTERLLKAYENAGGDKVRVRRLDSDSTAALDAAAAEGMQGFNRERGNVCYLGIAVVQDGRKEVLPYLSPDWQSALEVDLTRAIARVAQPTARTSAVTTAEIDPATKEQVRRVVPNLDSISIEDATSKIRETALEEFQVAAKEFQRQIAAAELQLREAQTSGSSAEQQSAMQLLQQLQAEQARRLKEIAARAQGQVDALKQLKSPASP